MSISATRYLSRLSDLLQATEATVGDQTVLAFDQAAEDAAASIQASTERGGKLLIVANGGSASIASHLQNDLCKACGVQALVFTEAPLLTALSNDDGYDTAYETLTRLWAGRNDLLIAISSSGKSENILRAVAAMRAAGGGVITLSGFGSDNPVRSAGDINFYVRSEHYGLVETAHAAICHYLSDSVGGLLDIGSE
jgi:D-sedoheptulose 7-phosphate isomerase